MGGVTLTDPPTPDNLATQPVGEPTGHREVDAVLESLVGLSGRPVSEHVAVYESASAALRDALSGAVGPTPA